MAIEDLTFLGEQFQAGLHTTFTFRIESKIAKSMENMQLMKCYTWNMRVMNRYTQTKHRRAGCECSPRKKQGADVVPGPRRQRNILCHFRWWRCKMRPQRFHVLVYSELKNKTATCKSLLVISFSDFPVLVFIALAEIRHTPCSN